MDGMFGQFHTEDFLARLLQFFMGGQLDKKNSWMDYPSVIPQAGSRHDVLHRSIRDTVSYFAQAIPGLSPMSDYIGRGVATALVGNPRNAYGLPTEMGFMPAGWGGGTATSAFQTSLRLNSQRYLQQQQQKVSQSLRDQYINNFYKVMYPNEQKKRNQAIAAAKKNPFSVPRVLSFALDPAQLRRQQRNIQDTAANTLQYGIQSQPLSINNTRFAKVAMTTAKDLAISASKNPSQFGGFTPAAVTQMANALSKGTDIFAQFRSAGNGGVSQAQIKRAADSFTAKVKQFTDALQPLRDTFGNNVEHMADMITTLSGLPFGQLSKRQVQMHATNISNTLRATGLAPAALTPYVAGVNAALRRYEPDSITKLSALSLGTHLAVLGNRQGPSTMSRAQYIGQITDAYASGQASINSRRIAQAYAIAVNENGFTGSIQEFINGSSKEWKGRPWKGIRNAADPLSAAQQAAGVKNTGQLMKGSGYRQMQFALKDKALASLAVQQQYKEQLNVAVHGATYRHNDIDHNVQTALRTALSDPSANRQLITRLFTQDGGLSLKKGSEDIELMMRATKLNKDQAIQAIKLANTIRVQSPQIGARAQAVMQTRIHSRFQAQQQQLRQVFKELDAKPTGGIYTVLSAFIKGKEGNLDLTDDKGKTLPDRKGKPLNLSPQAKSGVFKYLQLFGDQIFNIPDYKDKDKREPLSDTQRLKIVQQRMKNLTAALGGNAGIAASVMIAGTTGAFSADAKYRSSVQTLSKGGAKTKEYTQALDYIQSTIYFGQTGNGAKLYSNLKVAQKEAFRQQLTKQIKANIDKGMSSQQARAQAIDLMQGQVLKQAVKNSTAIWAKSAGARGSQKSLDAVADLYESGQLGDSWSQLVKGKSDADKGKLKKLRDAGITTQQQYKSYIKYMDNVAGNVTKKPSANIQNVLSSLTQTLGILAKALNEFLGVGTTGSDTQSGKGNKNK